MGQYRTEQVKCQSADQRNAKEFHGICRTLQSKKGMGNDTRGNNIKQQSVAEFCGTFGIKSAFVRTKADGRQQCKNGHLTEGSPHILQKHFGLFHLQ